MSTTRCSQLLVVVATCLIASQTASTAQAQIPAAAVEAALQGPKRTMMVTGSSDHKYAHRTRITPAKVTRTDNKIVAEGMLENIVKFNDNGSMKYRITIEGNNPPSIEIFAVNESKQFTRTLGKVVELAKKVGPVIIAVFSKADSTAGVYDLKTVAAVDKAAAEQLGQLDEKDWKVPCLALVSAIAAKLKTTR
jgi:hypothetical protein